MLCDILFDGIQGHRLRIRINPYCSPSSPTLRFQPEGPLPFLRTCTPLSSSRHHGSNTFSSEFPSFCEMTRKRSVHSNRCAVGITVIAQDSPSLVLSVTLPLSSNRTCPSFWMSVLGMVQCTVFLVSESKRLPVVVEEEDSVSKRRFPYLSSVAFRIGSVRYPVVFAMHLLQRQFAPEREAFSEGVGGCGWVRIRLLR